MNFTYHLESLAHQTTVISESVYKQVGDEYHCTPRGLVFSRGVGGVHTYNLLAKSTIPLAIVSPESDEHSSRRMNTAAGQDASKYDANGEDGLMTVKIRTKASCTIL